MVNLFFSMDYFLFIDGSVQTEKTFEFGIQALFLYNNEHIIFLEENLNYDDELSKDQFHVIDNAKISDIVHLVSKFNELT